MASGTARAGVGIWFARIALTVLAALAVWRSSYAWDAYVTARDTPNHSWVGDYILLLAWFVISGASFTLACRIPFALRGVSWWALVLALVAALLIAHFAYLGLVESPTTRPSWLYHVYRLDAANLEEVFATLIGVALALVPGTRRRA